MLLSIAALNCCCLSVVALSTPEILGVRRLTASRMSLPSELETLVRLAAFWVVVLRCSSRARSWSRMGTALR